MLSNNKSHLIISIVTVIIPIVFQLFFIRYIAYYVDKSVYGEFVIVQTIILAMNGFFLTISNSAFPRFFNESKDKPSYVNLFRSSTLLICGAALLLIPVLYFTYSRFEIETYLQCYVMFCFSAWLNLNTYVFMYSLARFKYMLMKVLESSSSILFPIWFYHLDPTLTSFLNGSIVGIMLTTFTGSLLLRKHFTFYWHIDISLLKHYTLFAAPMLTVALTSWSVSYVNRFFIDTYLNVQDVAFYALMGQVAGFASVIGNIYGLYVYPQFYRQLSNDKTNAYLTYNFSLKILLSVLLTTLVILFFIPKNVFALLLGNLVYQKTYYVVFLLLMASSTLAVYQTAYAMFFNVEHKLHIYMYIWLFSFGINLLLNYFLIISFGLIGVALASIMTFLLLILLQVLYRKFYS